MGIFTKTKLFHLAGCILKFLKKDQENLNTSDSNDAKTTGFNDICDSNKKNKSDVIFEAVTLLKSKGHITLNDDKVFLKTNLQATITPAGIAAAKSNYYNTIYVLRIIATVLTIAAVVFILGEFVSYLNSD